MSAVRSKLVSLIAANLMLLAGCDDLASTNAADNNITLVTSASPSADVGDGRTFASGATIWEQYKSGGLFCYDLVKKDESYKSIEYVENISNDQAKVISFLKWNAVEKQVFRLRMRLKDEYLCSKTDDWSIDHSSTYITSDGTAKVEPTDVSTDPDSVTRWRDDLRDRWSGILDQKFCYRYALRIGEDGNTHPGEFEEFKYADGVLQPVENPVYVVIYKRSDLSALTLRPQN